MLTFFKLLCNVSQGQYLVLKLALKLELEEREQESKILCPYCGRYVSISDYYSKHYGGRCLNLEFKRN